MPPDLANKPQHSRHRVKSIVSPRMASQQRKKSSTQFMISPKKIGSSTMYGNSEGEYCQIELDGLRNDVHLRMSVGRKAKII